MHRTRICVPFIGSAKLASSAYIAVHKSDAAERSRSAGQEKRNPPMIVTLVLAKLRNWKRYRQTVRELSRLSDRDLADLGISRFDIDSVARDAA
jgi:uncharacterized protein YjiS (DUF1127 family)